MHKIEILDLNPTILDEREHKILVDVLREEFALRKARYSKIPMMRKNGVMTDGSQVLMSAEFFEQTIQNIGIEEIVEFTTQHTFGIDMLMQEDPIYFELPFINGKNLSIAAEILEPAVVMNRKRLTPELIKLKSLISDYYNKSLEYEDSALEKLKNAAIENPQITSYRTQIKYMIGSVRRGRLLFIAGSEPPPKDKKKREQSAIETLEIFKHYHTMLESEVFSDIDEVAKTFAAMGNVTKFMPQRLREYGLECYKVALAILGPHPNILKGIEYLIEIEKTKK